MPYDFAAYYRELAEASRKRANTSKTQIEKDRWLAFAREYLEFAERAEREKKD
jgi:hypothetical protein